jgi:hypothetical protein
MEAMLVTTVRTAGVMGAIGVAVALAGHAPPPAAGGEALVARAPEAGLMAMAGRVPGKIRVLYARNGGMVLLREISVPPGGDVRELGLSADGRDLFVATEASGYALSTRTGRVEAQALAADSSRYVAGGAVRRG